MEYETSILECCGVIGVKSFDGDYDTAEQVRAEIADAIYSEYDVQNCNCEAEDDDEVTCTCPKGPGICLATTNEYQDRRSPGRALQEAGFTPVLKTLNYNSGNRITLWVKDISEGKTPVTLTQAPPPAPPAQPNTELMAALKAYVERNPNPTTRAAWALVEAFKKQFPE